MTTFKLFIFKITNVSHSKFWIPFGILIFAFLCSSNLYSQTAVEHTVPGLSLKSENSEKILSSETEDLENRWIDDLALDQERSDGIDMFLSATNYRSSSKITCKIEFLQDGHTLVQVLDPSSGELLKTIFEGPTKIGIEEFEINKREFSARSILIVATHKVSSGQMIVSNLEFDISGTDDFPLSLNELEGLDFDVQLTPTLGRGVFQISANFKSNENVSVKVYDLTGRLIETLYAGNIQDGAIIFEGNSDNWKAGNYIVCIHSEKGSWIKKMIVQ